jgi:hypothetical protein
MSYRSSILAFALLAVLMAAMAPARAADDGKYPNWRGQWDVINPRYGGQMIKFDPTKAWGKAQQAPLTAEYEKVLDDSMADQAAGGIGNYPTTVCLPGGMPRVMASVRSEYVITPETTYLMLGSEMRRIFTDGRNWPEEIEPDYVGYSIGRWIDPDGTGVYSVLDVETRGPFKGPRAYDASGLPLAFDNLSIFRERFHLDRNDPNLLHDEITTIDHALTRPWSVDKTFKRSSDPYPAFSRVNCTETTQQVVIGKDTFMLSADGMLMPSKKDQVPPDLRYFKPAQR